MDNDQPPENKTTTKNQKQTQLLRHMKKEENMTYT